MADESDDTEILKAQSPEKQSPQEQPPHPASLFMPGQKQKIESLPGELMMMILDYCNIDRPTLKALSLSNRNLRQLCIPLVFRSVSIGHLRVHCKEPIKTSHAILESLVHLLECEAILMSIRYFVFHSYQHAPSHPDTPRTLIKILNKMPNVTEVGLDLGSKAQWVITAGLESLLVLSLESLHCPSVKKVWIEITELSEIEPDLSGFVKSFPNLEMLHLPVGSHRSPSAFNVTRALGSLDKFQALLLDRGQGESPWYEGLDMWRGWEVNDIENLHKWVPNIRHLALKGHLHDVDMDDFVLPISSFTKLERLEITDEQVIKSEDMVRYNATLGPDSDDEDYHFDVMNDELCELICTHPRNNPREDTARLFFDKCPSLKRVCIVTSYICDCDVFDAKRSADGSELLDVVENKDFWDPSRRKDRPAPAVELQLTKDSWPRTMVSRHGHPNLARFER